MCVVQKENQETAAEVCNMALTLIHNSVDLL